MTVRNLQALLAPRSVVVVGASGRAGSLGERVWRNVTAGTFEGTITPVNPAHRMLAGVPVVAHCSDLPAAPDLALVCTPPATLKRVIRELAAIGARAAAIFTATADAALAQTLRELARPSTLRLLGPHSLGVLSPRIGLNASRACTPALPGEIALVCQSPTLADAMLDESTARGVGFSHVACLGDSLDVDVADLIDHLASDASTRAILLYVETLASSRKFMSAARAAARNKPVIIVKAGRTGIGPAPSSREAAAVADAVLDAAIRRAGMLRVATLQELFAAARTLARFHGDIDRGLAMVTNSAGAGLLASDAAARAGVELRPPAPALARRLTALLPAGSAPGNPLDLGDGAPAQRHADTLGALLDDPDTGTVLLLQAPGMTVAPADLARACLPLVRPAARRMMACWIGGAAMAEARKLFEDAGVADFGTPEEAVQAFSMMQAYARNQAMLLEAPAADAGAAPDLPRARALVREALAAGRTVLSAADALALLRACGVPATDAAQAMAARPNARRLRAGALVDPVFGPALLLAEDGAEAVYALPPLNRALAHDLALRSAVGLRRRDEAVANIDAVCDVMIALARMQADLPELAGLDIAPLWVDDQGALALDARVRLSARPVAGMDRFAILPYPSELQRTVDWRGRRLEIRPVRPEDEALHRAFMARVSQDDLRMRFFSSRRELPRSELARLVQIDYAREMAFVAVAPTKGDAPATETLGVARALCDPDNEEAEFAVLVRSDLKRQGLGRLLLGTLLGYLRSKGTRRVVGYVLAGNAPMRGLVGALGFRALPSGAEPGVVSYGLDLQDARAG